MTHSKTVVSRAEVGMRGAIPALGITADLTALMNRD
jgi:hypothetical protein